MSPSTMNAPIYVHKLPAEYCAARNNAQEFVFPQDLGTEIMLASENALRSIWMTEEEDEAWKDL